MARCAHDARTEARTIQGLIRSLEDKYAHFLQTLCTDKVNSFSEGAPMQPTLIWSSFGWQEMNFDMHYGID